LGIACSPAKERAKIIDIEGIIMEEELTGLEINLAQQLHVLNIDGLQSTLLQGKSSKTSKELKKICK